MGSESTIIANLIENHPELQTIAGAIRDACSIMTACCEKDGKILICGNGGSAADSNHIAGELIKGFLKKRSLPDSEKKMFTDMDPVRGPLLAENLQGALPAVSLAANPSVMSAIANDTSPDMIFAQQVYGLGRKNDVLIAISTSGNAKNVLLAAVTARALGLKVIGLTGRTGGAFARFCDTAVLAPADSTPDIQELHVAIYHALCAATEEHFFER